MYLPSIGLFLAVCWGLPELARRHAVGRAALAAAGVAAVLALTLATRAQVRRWSDSVTLFRHAVAATEGNYVAHLALAKALHRQGDRAGAAAQYRAALRLRPGLRDARKGLAEIRRETERIRRFRPPSPSPARPADSGRGQPRYRSRPQAS
jgi:hypothetical protein